MTIVGREQRRRRGSRKWRWLNTHHLIQGIVDEPRLFLAESTESLEVPRPRHA
jgi:hypothetical protein